MTNKEKILAEAKANLISTVEMIKVKLTEVLESLVRTRQKLAHSSVFDRLIDRELLNLNEKRKDELDHLEQSPYFFRCDVKFDDEESGREMYFGKFQFSERETFSWTAPVSALRFEELGDISYQLPKGGQRTGQLLRKDQFMITGGRMVFMASEREKGKREMIYQEYLAERKKGFMLPEIIEKMEKKQDEVIRADYHGSYLIAGPAGSGKTTLALHRVAYLAQSPDTMNNFPSAKMIVFVQDRSTLEYFSAILPELGINDVVITTYYDWAFAQLGLKDYKYASRYGQNEIIRDRLEYFKNKSLENSSPVWRQNIEDILLSVYKGILPADCSEQWQAQIAEKILDRFDIAILFKAKLQKEQGVFKIQRCAVEDKRGRLQLKDIKLPLKYALIVLDEAQNYLPDEIRVLKNCLNENDAMLYVGDLAQKTKLGTIQSWAEVNEEFGETRKAVLEKVYRNTKEILKYISQQNYPVSIPDKIKPGEPVQKLKVASTDELLIGLNKILANSQKKEVGIISIDTELITELNEKIRMRSGLHCLTVNEAQGVEFEVVIYIKNKTRQKHEESDLEQKKSQLERDLEYVAMTRAMEELWVIRMENGPK